MKDQKDLISELVDDADFNQVRRYREKLDNVRLAFYILAVISVANALLSELIIIGTINLENLGLAVAIALLYVGMALWTKDNPLGAIIGGLVVFIAERILGQFFLIQLSFFGSSIFLLGTFVYLIIQGLEAYRMRDLLKKIQEGK